MLPLPAMKVQTSSTVRWTTALDFFPAASELRHGTARRAGENAHLGSIWSDGIMAIGNLAGDERSRHQLPAVHFDHLAGHIA